MGVEATESAGGPGELHSTQHVPATRVLQKSMLSDKERLEGNQANRRNTMVSRVDRRRWEGELERIAVGGCFRWAGWIGGGKKNAGSGKGGTDDIINRRKGGREKREGTRSESVCVYGGVRKKRNREKRAFPPGRRDRLPAELGQFVAEG